MNYYEIIIKHSNNSTTTLFYPSVKGLSNAKRHATTQADKQGRWKNINIYYVNESADVRELVAERVESTGYWFKLKRER